MKTLIYPNQVDPMCIKLTRRDGIEVNADDEYSIKELFSMKAEYAKIEIKRSGLLKQENKNIEQLHGWINLMDYDVCKVNNLERNISTIYNLLKQ